MRRKEALPSVASDNRESSRHMSKITISTAGKLQVPQQVEIPFIEGDGVGPEITAVTQKVVDAAVTKAYGGKRRILWKEVLAGGKSFEQTGSWLPDETMQAFRDYKVGIKGPLTTPVGGGIRSLNVALRQELDLYVCLRPVRWFRGVVSPVKEPQQVDMHIFRENTEDIYAGIEWQAGTPEAADRAMEAAKTAGKVIVKDVIADAFLQNTLLIPEEYSVIATLNLNGDYISDQLAAMVGGIGIAPGANINYLTGHAIFEATHGTAPNIAGKDTVNPSSLLLSAVMMLEYLGWKEAALLITGAMESSFEAGRATGDLARFMPGGTALSTSAFGEELLGRL